VLTNQSSLPWSRPIADCLICYLCKAYIFCFFWANLCIDEICLSVWLCRGPLARTAFIRPFIALWYGEVKQGPEGRKGDGWREQVGGKGSSLCFISVTAPFPAWSSLQTEAPFFPNRHLTLRSMSFPPPLPVSTPLDHYKWCLPIVWCVFCTSVKAPASSAAVRSLCMCFFC